MMTKHVWIAVMVLVVSMPSNGQVWKDKYLQAQDLYAKESYDQAFALATESLASYEAEGAAVVENHAAILRLLSTLCYVRQKLPEGLDFVARELQVRNNKQDTSYAVALTNRALFEEQLGHNDKAVQTLLVCRPILLQYYKDDDLRVLECNLKLATNYYFLNDYAKAREWFLPAMTVIEKKEEYTEGILEAYYYAGMLYLETGETQNAEATFSKTGKLYASAELTGSLSYPMVLYGLAYAYHRNQSHGLAETKYSEAQSIYENLAGKEGENYFTIVGARVVNLHYLNKKDQAGEMMKQLKTDPAGKISYAGAAASLGALYHGRAEYATAEMFYREALASYAESKSSVKMEIAETNLNLALLCADQGNFTEARQRITESRTTISKEKGESSKEYIKLLNRSGIVDMQAGDVGAAKKSYEEARTQIDKFAAKAETENIINLNGLGEVQWRNGNYRKSDSLFQVIIGLYATSGKVADRYQAIALNNLAISKQSQGRFNESLDLLKRAASITAKTFGKGSIAYGTALEGVASLRLRLGDLGHSKNELDSALHIYEKMAGKESFEYAAGLMSLGRYYQVAGDYTQAEPCYKTAREIIRKKKGGQSADYATVVNNLALLYQTLGNYRDAEVLFGEAKAIIEKTRGKSDAEYATTVQNLATLYQLEGAYDRAEPLLKESLEIDRIRLGEHHPHYAVTLQNLATLYQKMGKGPEAQRMLEQVLDVYGRQLGKKHPSYITTLSNLAALYQDQANYTLAETTWKQCVDLRKEVQGESHPDYARALYGLAGVYHAQGQWVKAKQYYEPVIQKYHKQVVEFFPALSEKEKSAFYAKIKPVFDAYQDFCVQFMYANPAERDATIGRLYDLQLSTKAILLNATNKVRSRILASGNQELKDLFRDWLGTKEDIVRYLNASAEERTLSRLDMNALETKANDLEKKLSTQSDAFRSQFERETVGWKEVKNSLQEGEAAVEILRVRRKYVKDSIYYVGLVLTRTSVAPELILWKQGTQLEGRKFKFHRNTIKYHVNDTVSYVYFWKPLGEKLKPGSTVFLSCDGVFNKVNFNSLYERSSKRFVIEDYRLRQVSNTRELIGRKTALNAPTNTAVLFGYADFNLGGKDVIAHNTKRNLARSLGFDGEEIPVLPATEKEVDGISAVLTQNKWAAANYKRAEASEENMKKAENPKVMHVATHGFFLSDLDLDDSENSEITGNPLFRSGVLLAGAGVDRDNSKSLEDGVLTAYEAMNLNLDRTELVVLSACETGLGEVRNGEGVYGLQRSFLVAGANSVLMSLWQVDDVATQEMMNAFYSFWLSGTDKHEAFRKAQLQSKEKYQIPYFWGAFVLIGN